jgi:hypothetical protein
VSEDKSTMPTHLADHLAAGRHSPGVMLIRSATSLREVLDHLVLTAHASEAHEWVDMVVFIP